MSSEPVLLSFTAPRVTEREMKEEREALTAQEALELQLDVQGRKAITRETPEKLSKALKDLQEAMDCIKDPEKEDYLRALEVAPEVVDKESNPIWFVHCEDYDGTAAAHRLAMYWKIRCTVFDPDHAFLPLQEGGALSAEDKTELLSTGGFQLLPADNMGRQVLYFRRSSLKRSQRENPSLVRSMFPDVNISVRRSN